MMGILSFRRRHQAHAHKRAQQAQEIARTAPMFDGPQAVEPRAEQAPQEPKQAPVKRR